MKSDKIRPIVCVATGEIKVLREEMSARGMDRWKGRVALVTGASSGIGLAVAVALAEEGMKVVACARRTSPIEDAAKTRPNLRPYKVIASEEGDFLD